MRWRPANHCAPPWKNSNWVNNLGFRHVFCLNGRWWIFFVLRKCGKKWNQKWFGCFFCLVEGWFKVPKVGSFWLVQRMWNFGCVFGSFPCWSTKIAKTSKTSMILRKGLDAWLLHLSFKGMKSMGWELAGSIVQWKRCLRCSIVNLKLNKSIWLKEILTFADCGVNQRCWHAFHAYLQETWFAYTLFPALSFGVCEEQMHARCCQTWETTQPWSSLFQLSHKNMSWPPFIHHVASHTAESTITIWNRS